jgi:hypothetical protein
VTASPNVFGAPVVPLLVDGVQGDARDDVVQAPVRDSEVNGARELRLVLGEKSSCPKERLEDCIL